WPARREWSLEIVAIDIRVDTPIVDMKSSDSALKNERRSENAPTGCVSGIGGTRSCAKRRRRLDRTISPSGRGSGQRIAWRGRA
ncbi:MAG TPA: hypothetical protein VI259_28485, partial [Gemmatimonadaceae bacterium]